MDDLATIIFSSGSTGEPKGVMLSHYNIGSNIEQLGQVFAFPLAGSRCSACCRFSIRSASPARWRCPACSASAWFIIANPLDAKTIGPLVLRIRRARSCWPRRRFCNSTCAAAAPEQFGSLRLVAVGAEKLPERLATAFDEQFGIRPFEAYGCTECSPAVTVNTHDFRAAGFRQVGAKRGKIGHPLPGICVRIVDPESRAPVATGQPGLLLVRGPNVMLGYLGQPEKTAEVLIDEPRRRQSLAPSDGRRVTEAPGDGKWYITGDIAALDEDGFLQITDRLSRFSKIGGEMVPHIKVEEKLHEFAGVTEQTFVVTSVAGRKERRTA